MNFKTTIVLLAAVALVGAYFVLVEQQVPTTYELERQAAQDADQPGQMVFAGDRLSAPSVVSMTISRGDEPPVALARRDQEWFQTQPVRFPLNNWSAKQIVDAAASLRYSQRFTAAMPGESSDQPSLAQLSLSPPKATVTLETEGPASARHAVHLGKTAVGGRAYVTIDDDPRVYVVSDDLHRQVIDSGVRQWRKNSLNAPDEGRTHRVALTAGGRTITMDKADGAWFLSSPDAGRVSKKAVAELLTAVSQAYLSEFVADKPADLSVYGLDNPATVLWIDLPSFATEAVQPQDEGQKTSTAQAKSYSLRIGSAVDLKNDRFFATWGGDDDQEPSPGDVVFILSKFDVEKFSKAVDQLREPHVTPVDPADVRELTIDKPGTPAVKLLRSPDVGWSFEQPGPGFKADSGVVSELVESIAGLEAQSFEPQPDSEIAPLVTATLTVIGQPEPEVLRVFPATADGAYPVLRNNETICYLVPAEKLAALFEPAVSLRQRTVLDLSADQVVRVALRQADNTVYVFERQPADDQSENPAADAGEASSASPPPPVELGAWSLQGRETFETAAFEQLLKQLAPLRAKRWLPPPDADLKPATLGLDIETTGGQTYQFVINFERSVARLTSDPQPSWFELSDDLIAAIGAEYRDRTLLSLKPADIESVRVSRGETSVTVQRDSSGRYTVEGGQGIEPSLAGKLFDALAGLRAERYVTPAQPTQPTLQVRLKGRQGEHLLSIVETPDSAPLGTDGARFFTLAPETVSAIRDVVSGSLPQNQEETQP